MAQDVVDRIVKRLVAGGLIPNTPEAQAYAADIIRDETRKRVRLITKRMVQRSAAALTAPHVRN